ncbi:Mariner Mos1 transposase [Araneus ventricosus]|uniref:Mariner Mos1 transposase n=1 Tax=Araneus ventricosus TaxID=182803 RepID=A0A4Y2G0L0_ARAVE|nr:Mariner Mos1 transposase [Araneus ventricosus]
MEEKRILSKVECWKLKMKCNFLVGSSVGIFDNLCFKRSKMRVLKLFPLGSENAYGCPQNEATWQCFEISYSSEEGNGFLNKIVTGELQNQNNSRWSGGTHGRKKSSPKIMCTVFWERQGILLFELLPRGETINAVRYCETLRKLRCAIQNKRRGMLSQGIVLLHDNARPHSAGVTQNLIQQFGWEQFDHPPFSPDLAPSDYHLFLNLKRDFGERRFDRDYDAENGVQQWPSSEAASFFEEGIDRLFSRYDKCLKNGGNYVEK